MPVTREDLDEIAAEFKRRATRLAFTLGGQAIGAVNWELPLSGCGSFIGICAVRSFPERNQRVALVTITAGPDLDKIVELAKTHLLRDMRIVKETALPEKESWSAVAEYPEPGPGRLSSAPDMNLIIAAQQGNLAELKERLAAGSDPNQCNMAGVPALFLAVAEGRPEAAAALIEYGADVHRTTENGLAPLVMAASRGNVEMVKLLLAAGADVRVGNADGSTALEWATRQGHTAVAELIRNVGGDDRLPRAESKGHETTSAWERLGAFKRIFTKKPGPPRGN